MTDTQHLDEAAITQTITETLDGVDTVVSSGDTFFFYNPGGDLPPDHRLPFATLVTGDHHDHVSNLSRPSVYRLNIGVSKETYRSLFGPPPPPPGEAGVVDTGHDFTTLDRIMPHPVYASMSWVCVLNPSAETFEAVRPLLAEAHARAARRRTRQRAT